MGPVVDDDRSHSFICRCPECGSSSVESRCSCPPERSIGVGGYELKAHASLDQLMRF